MRLISLRAPAVISVLIEQSDMICHRREHQAPRSRFRKPRNLPIANLE
jgi:hypothetical protein